MNRTVLAAAAVLTVILYVVGYAVQFAITFLAMTFDLPGPYSDSPMAWIWGALGLAAAFGMSLGFCRWFARRIEKKLLSERTFE